MSQTNYGNLIQEKYAQKLIDTRNEIYNMIKAHVENENRKEKTKQEKLLSVKIVSRLRYSRNTIQHFNGQHKTELKNLFAEAYVEKIFFHYIADAPKRLASLAACSCLCFSCSCVRECGFRSFGGECDVRELNREMFFFCSRFACSAFFVNGLSQCRTCCNDIESCQKQ